MILGVSGVYCLPPFHLFKEKRRDIVFSFPYFQISRYLVDATLGYPTVVGGSF